MKMFLAVLLLVGLVCLYQSGEPARLRTAAAEQRVATRAAVGYERIVVECDGPDDLLNKLRNVRTGQMIEIRDIGKHLPTPIGIACSDKAGIARYLADRNAELGQLNAAISAELKRINMEP